MLAGEALAEGEEAWRTLLAGLVLSFSKIFCDCAFVALIVTYKNDYPREIVLIMACQMRQRTTVAECFPMKRSRLDDAGQTGCGAD